MTKLSLSLPVSSLSVRDTARPSKRMRCDRVLDVIIVKLNCLYFSHSFLFILSCIFIIIFYSFFSSSCSRAAPCLYHWSEGLRIYNFLMSKRLTYFLKKHEPVIFARERDNPASIFSNDDLSDGECIPESTLFQGRDMNGFSLDKGKRLRPDERVWSSTSITEYDDHFTR